LVITDLRLSDASGIDLITHIKSESTDTEVILMTAYGSVDITIEAIKRGAYYYLEKPCTADYLFALVERALQFATLRRENETLKRTLAKDAETFGVIGRDPKMREIIDTIRTVAPSSASVLIEGESGTGKELIATAFHTQSQRASGPFIRINCAAIPRELIESELFGYKKGAFTGADRDKRGLIEAASQGTLLLDEIGEMPAQLQTKLLRVLQERKLRRLGDEREINVNFRLVSATNRNTVALLEEGVLRKDLYFRISTVKIKVPPLRERFDDVLLIAKRFLSASMVSTIKEFETSRLRLFCAWSATIGPGTYASSRASLSVPCCFVQDTNCCLAVCQRSSIVRESLVLSLLFPHWCRWRRLSVKRSGKPLSAPPAT